MLDRREAQRPAAAHAHPDRADLPAAPRPVAAQNRDRHHRCAGLEREPGDPALGPAQPAVTDASPLRKDHERAATLQDAAAGGHRLLVGLAALDRERTQAIEDPALPALVEQLLLRHEVDRPADAAADQERVEEAAVVGREDDRALLGNVLASATLEREVELDRQAKDGPDRPEDGLVHALPARALVIAGQVPRRHGLGYPDGGAQLRCEPCPASAW